MSNLAFNPILTPREMVLKGIFGGAYFGVNAGPTMTKELADFLKVEFGDIESNKWRAEKYMTKRNCFNVRSGMPYGYWLEMNWMHFRDQYGWFEWYVKYNRGFRGEDDDRQIRRWKTFVDLTADGVTTYIARYMPQVIGKQLQEYSRVYCIGDIRLMR